MEALKKLLDNLVEYFTKPLVKPEVKTAKPKARAKKK